MDSFDWVVMIDVNESLFLETINNSNNKSNAATLQSVLLEEYQDQHASLVGTLQLNRFFFGGPTKDVEQFRNKTTHPLVINNREWRRFNCNFMQNKSLYLD